MGNQCCSALYPYIPGEKERKGLVQVEEGQDPHEVNLVLELDRREAEVYQLAHVVLI